jgi:hypothetical protein
MNWVIVIVYDGPVRLEVMGDDKGRPFASEGEAMQAARVFPRQGARYSVYVTQIGSI